MKQFVMSMEAYDAPLPYPVTSNTPEVSIDTLENGLNNAFESLLSLNKLKQAFTKNANKPVNKTQVKIGLLALEHVKKSVGIFDNGLIVAAECFQENVSTEGIVSGISSVMKSIWDAIKRTFAYIGEMIGNFFLGGKRELTIKKGSQECKEMVGEVKDIKESNKSSKTVGVMTDHRSYSPFLYNGNDGSVKKLHDLLSQAGKSIKDTESMITTLEVVNVNIQESVNMLKKDHSDPTSYSDALKGSGIYHAGIKGLFSDCSDWNHYKKDIAASISVDSNLIDQSSVREVSGLTGGRRLFFFSRTTDTKADSDSDGLYYLASLHDTPTEHRVTEITYDVFLLSGYVDTLNETYALLDSASKLCDQKCSRMVTRQEQMLKDMEATFNLMAGDNDEEARRYMRYCRNVTGSIMKTTKDVVTVINSLDRSVTHHKDLAAVLISNYKKAD